MSLFSEEHDYEASLSSFNLALSFEFEVPLDTITQSLLKGAMLCVEYCEETTDMKVLQTRLETIVRVLYYLRLRREANVCSAETNVLAECHLILASVMAELLERDETICAKAFIYSNMITKTEASISSHHTC